MAEARGGARPASVQKVHEPGQEVFQARERERFKLLQGVKNALDRVQRKSGPQQRSLPFFRKKARSAGRAGEKGSSREPNARTSERA